MIEDSEPMSRGWVLQGGCQRRSCRTSTVHLSLILSPLQDLIGVIAASRARRTPHPPVQEGNFQQKG